MGCLEDDIKRIRHFRDNEPYYDMLECIMKIDFDKQTTSLAYRSHRMRLFRERERLDKEDKGLCFVSQNTRAVSTRASFYKNTHENRDCDRHFIVEELEIETTTLQQPILEY